MVFMGVQILEFLLLMFVQKNVSGEFYDSSYPLQWGVLAEFMVTMF